MRKNKKIKVFAIKSDAAFVLAMLQAETKEQDMEAAILLAFRHAETWHLLGYESYDQAIDDMTMKEITKALKTDLMEYYEDAIDSALDYLS